MVYMYHSFLVHSSADGHLMLYGYENSLSRLPSAWEGNSKTTTMAFPQGSTQRPRQSWP